MIEKKIYTKKELIEELESYLKRKSIRINLKNQLRQTLEKSDYLKIKDDLEKDGEEALIHYRKLIFKEFSEQGFNCIYNFCQLEKGWVANIEECCPYCIKSSVENYGSRKEKEFFNKVNTINATLPITSKEIAKENKKARTRNKKRVVYSMSKKMGNNEYKKLIKILKENNVSVLRKTKETIKEGLFKYILNNKDYYIYLPEIKNINNYFIPMVDSEEELLNEINRVLKKQGGEELKTIKHYKRIEL